MREGSFLFSHDWTQRIRDLGETGMSYVVATVTLKDGRKFDQVVIAGGWLAGIRGLPDIPFRESDIATIKATHEKWNWKEEP